jgi:hypothetical protein
MGKGLLIIVVLLVLSGCNFPADVQQEPGELFRQRILNSKFVVYDFYYGSEFVTTSDYKGFAILDSAIPFSKNKIRELPSTLFAAIPTSSEIKMIDITYNYSETEKDTVMTPAGEQTEKIENMLVSVARYNSTFGSASSSTGLMRYQFDSIKETEDSITFYNVSKVFGGKAFASVATFVKGNVKIFDSANGNINHVGIRQLIVKRGDIYKPKKPFMVVPNQPIVGEAQYEFYPRHPIKSTQLTDYGIFKRIK